MSEEDEPEHAIVSIGGVTYKATPYKNKQSASVTLLSDSIGVYPDNTPIDIGVWSSTRSQNIPAEYMGATLVSSMKDTVQYELVRLRHEHELARRGHRGRIRIQHQKMRRRNAVGIYEHDVSTTINRLPVANKRSIHPLQQSVSLNEAVSIFLSSQCAPCGLVATEVATHATGLPVCKTRPLSGLFQLRAFAFEMPLHIMAGRALLCAYKQWPHVTHEAILGMGFQIKTPVPADLCLLWRVFGGPKPMHVIVDQSEREV